MGTLPEFQGRGIGAAVLKEGERIASQRNFDLIWCNARTSAYKYYVKQGYTAFDDIFEIEGIGPHKVMYKAL
jgi:ribosomal protein S18 acetylase RimI-like enzyme